MRFCPLVPPENSLAFHRSPVASWFRGPSAFWPPFLHLKHSFREVMRSPRGTLRLPPESGRDAPRAPPASRNVPRHLPALPSAIAPAGVSLVQSPPRVVGRCEGLRGPAAHPLALPLCTKRSPKGPRSEASPPEWGRATKNRGPAGSLLEPALAGQGEGAPRQPPRAPPPPSLGSRSPSRSPSVLTPAELLVVHWRTRVVPWRCLCSSLAGARAGAGLAPAGVPAGLAHSLALPVGMLLRLLEAAGAGSGTCAGAVYGQPLRRLHRSLQSLASLRSLTGARVARAPLPKTFSGNSVLRTGSPLYPETAPARRRSLRVTDLSPSPASREHLYRKLFLEIMS
jgi:hypothetical protein